MSWEYNYFVLAGAYYMPEPLREQLKTWLNGIGRDGWEVVALGQQRDNPAAWVAWAKRPLKSEPPVPLYWPRGPWFGGFGE